MLLLVVLELEMNKGCRQVGTLITISRLRRSLQQAHKEKTSLLDWRGCGGRLLPLLLSGLFAACSPASGIVSVTQPPNSDLSTPLVQAIGRSLLYLARETGGPNDAPISVLTYPAGKHVVSIRKLNLVTGVCSDKRGNISAVTFAGKIYSFPYGKTKPVLRLSVDGDAALMGCSIAHASSDLAVINNTTSGKFAVLIWHHKRNRPTSIALPFVGWSCAFDAQENLFVAGITSAHKFQLARLALNAAKFDIIQLPGTANSDPGGIQWDGQYLAIALSRKGNSEIDRISISGSKGNIVQRVKLRKLQEQAQFWIGDGIVVATAAVSGSVETGFWHYPAGGSPVKILPQDGSSGIAVSEPMQ